jgi:hypothetical protein
MRKYIFSLPGIFLLLRLRLGIISKLHRFTLEYLSLAKVNATFIFVYLVKVDFVPMALSERYHYAPALSNPQVLGPPDF